VRKVEWRAANFELPENARVLLKTLTDVTDYKAFVAFVRENFPPPEDLVVKVSEAPLSHWTMHWLVCFFRVANSKAFLRPCAEKECAPPGRPWRRQDLYR